MITLFALHPLESLTTDQLSQLEKMIAEAGEMAEGWLDQARTVYDTQTEWGDGSPVERRLIVAPTRADLKPGDEVVCGLWTYTIAAVTMARGGELIEPDQPRLDAAGTLMLVAERP